MKHDGGPTLSEHGVPEEIEASGSPRFGRGGDRSTKRSKMKMSALKCFHHILIKPPDSRTGVHLSR